MLIFPKRKLVLLAVPKTGTTAFEAALEPLADLRFSGAPSVKHATLRKYRRYVRPFLEASGIRGMKTVCVLREPVDWLRSWHAYRQRPEIEGKPHSTAGMSFEAFVEGYLQDPQPEFAHVGFQSRFVADGEGRPAVDHMFRYDDLDAFKTFLEARFEQALDIPRLNVSPERPAEPLPPELQARLERERAADFEVYRSIA
ncbi:MAG: gamma-glutamyl kinase [Pseudomonadota bacterium]